MKQQRRIPQHQQQQPRLVVRLHPEIFEASRLPSFAAVTGSVAYKYAAATSGQEGGSAAAVAAASRNIGPAAAAAASAFAAAAQRETMLVSTAAAAVAGAAALTRQRQREKTGYLLLGDKHKKCLTVTRPTLGTVAEPPSEEMKKSVVREKSKRSEVYQRQLQQLEAAAAADDKALLQLLHNEEERLRQIKLQEAEEERQRQEEERQRREEERQRREEERQRQEEERRRQEEERRRQEEHARQVAAAAAAAREEQQRLERQAPEKEQQRRVEEEEARLRKQQEEEEQRRLAEEQQQKEEEEHRRLQLLLQEQQAQQQREDEERQREDEQRRQEKEAQQQQQAQEAQNRLQQGQEDVKQQEILTSQGNLEPAEEALETQLETASTAAVSATTVLPALDPAKPETVYIRDVLLLLAEDRRMREAQLNQLPGVSQDQVKALRISIKKQINTALNQLASTTSQVIRTCEGIRQYMRGLKVHPPEVSQYFMAQACERLLQLTEKGQYETEFRLGICLSYSWVSDYRRKEISRLIQEDERVERMFRAHVYATCCYAAPFYYRKKQGVSVEEFRATRGQRDGEDEEAFFSRMAACLRLWLSFLIASHMEEEAWSWLARFLNLNLATAKAARRVCACATVEGLKIAGPALLEAYGRQFKKIMDLIQNSLMPLLLAMQQKNEGTCISMYVTQLRTLVSDYYANNCTLPDPEGKSMKMESTEASPDI